MKIYNLISFFQVKVQVLDVNDNSPEFEFPDMNITSGRYFAAISSTAKFSTAVLHVKAHDRDSGKYGKLEYTILEGQGSNYFAIDSSSGSITTAATFENVDPEELPFKFNVQVRDNPNSTSNFNIAEATVIVNLIGEENFLVMSIEKAAHENLHKDGPKIAKLIEEKTGLLVGIDRIVVRMVKTENGTIDIPEDSDIWFYTIDPVTEIILDRNSTRLYRWVIAFSSFCW